MRVVVRGVILVWILMLTNLLYSETYYVSPEGNNDNTGSIDSPFASLQKGHDMMQAGDTLILRGGTYYPTDRINFTKDGSADSYYVVRSFPGELPVIDGENIPDGNINHGSTTTWAFNNAIYWKVTGPIKLTNGRGAGVYVEGENNIP